MKRSCLTAIAVVVLLIAGPALAQKANAISVVDEAAYSPQGARRLVVRSERLARDFVLVIHPPGVSLAPGSRPPAAGERMPAVYALDGGYDVAGPMAQILAGSGVMAPAYVVSISYLPRQGRRDVDLLHTPVTEGGTTYGGGGAAFQAFLSDDLRPFLEARFPLDPARAVLFGHSFGGVFAANVLATRPEAFSGYVIGSASAWRDATLVSRLAAAARRGQGRKVFVAAGDGETPRMLEATRDIAAAASGAGSALKVRSRVFEGENHVSYYPLLAHVGLAWTLPSVGSQRVAIAVPPERLDRLVGVYAYPDGRKITIERRGDKLFAMLTGLPGDAELLAETSSRFFVPGGFDVVMAFEGPETAPATVISVRTGGVETRGTRVKP